LLFFGLNFCFLWFVSRLCFSMGLNNFLQFFYLWTFNLFLFYFFLSNWNSR
jgi:hypothetical protein